MGSTPSARDRVVLGPVEYRRLEELRPYRYPHIKIPDLLPEDLEQLEWSINQYGLDEPLVILADGRIVEGQHRHALALARGLVEGPVQVGTFPDPVVIELYALEEAFIRRQLTPAQKYLIAEPLSRAEKEAAQERQKAALKQFHQRATALGQGKGKALKRLATAIQISTRKAEQIKTVVDRGRPELFERLLKGEVRPDAAYRQVVQAEQQPTSREKRERTDSVKHTAREGRPALRVIKRHSRPPTPPVRPAMPPGLPVELEGLYARAMERIEQSAQWPEQYQTLVWQAVERLRDREAEGIHVLSQDVRGAPEIPRRPEEQAATQ